MPRRCTDQSESGSRIKQKNIHEEKDKTSLGNIREGDSLTKSSVSESWTDEG